MSKPKSAVVLNSNQSSSAVPAAAGQPASENSNAGHVSAAGDEKRIFSPYQLEVRAALFKQRYSGLIGGTVESRGFGSNRLWMNSVDVRRSTECLGFPSIREGAAVSAAKAAAPEDAGKLTLAISIARNNPALSGPGYMIMRPFVEPMHQMCSKWLLVQSMRRLEAQMQLAGRGYQTGGGRAFSYDEFTAFTVNLNDHNLEEILAQRPGTYLAKPARGTMGQRQQLVGITSERVHKDLLHFLLSSQFLSMQRSQVILQRYVDRPLLIDKRKFDMRVYYVVVNAKRSNGESGYFAFLHPGFVRLCTAPYDASHKDLAVHLTNQSIQARHTSTFTELKEVTTWYPDELNRYLNRRRRLRRPNWARDVLYPKIAAILGYISALYRRHLDDRSFPTGTFRILGVDMLVDADLRVYLLEFNEFPAWGRRTSVLKVVKPNLWLEVTCLVSEVAIRYANRQPMGESDLVAMQNFRMVFSSEDPGLARRAVAGLY